MSAAGAIVGIGQHKPSRDEILALLRPGAHGAAGSVEIDVGSQFALGAIVTPFTREELLDRQPMHINGLRVVLIGRLDNRADLCRALDIRATASDVRLTAAAYSKWGTEFAGKLVGSFAALVWDGLKDRLVCAIDHVGARTLYYAATATSLIVASTIRQVRVLAGTSDELDEGYLLARLCVPAIGDLHSERTPYKGINRLLAGTTLIAGSSFGFHRSRYWKPEELPEATGSIRELGERLVQQLDEAVRSNCRTESKVMLTLSGGLDSSSIAGLATRSADRSVLPCRGLEAIALVYGSWSDAQEDGFRRSAENAFGIRALEVDATGAWYFRGNRPGLPPTDEPSACNAVQSETTLIAEASKSTGCNVVLYGLGGDELLAGSEYFIADLLGRGKFREWWSQTRKFARLGNRTEASTIWNLSMAPMLAECWPSMAGLRWHETARYSDTYWYRPPVPNWLIRDQRRRELIDHIYHETATIGIRPFARAEELFRLRTSMVTATMNDSSYYPAGVEMRNPFYDRRVVELALTMPGCLKLKAVGKRRFTKRVLRSGLRSVLPRTILKRRSKASLDFQQTRGLEHEWSRIWNDGRFELVERGIVDPELAKASLRAAQMGLWDSNAHLRALIVLELWLRQRPWQQSYGKGGEN